jgi:hypothetical protein
MTIGRKIALAVASVVISFALISVVVSRDSVARIDNN